MNNFNKVILSILAGIDVMVYISTPIIIATIWMYLFGYYGGSYVIFGLGLFSSVFRAIKVGWMK